MDENRWEKIKKIEISCCLLTTIQYLSLEVAWIRLNPDICEGQKIRNSIMDPTYIVRTTLRGVNKNEWKAGIKYTMIEVICTVSSEIPNKLLIYFQLEISQRALLKL